jgi:hypothetical protein
MLVMITVESIATETITIAIDPWRVERIGPALGEENMSYLTLASSTHSWRVKSSLENLVNIINTARMGGKQ